MEYSTKGGIWNKFVQRNLGLVLKSVLSGVALMFFPVKMDECLVAMSSIIQ